MTAPGAGGPNAASGQEAPRQPPAAPAISLPKGGGAIRGIGEKFAANPVTGTGSMSIPFPASAGRSGFGPDLVLSYDSGAGNGPFGFGWTLSLPSITRKTDKGLPRYADATESDVFVLSGAEDLVPVYRQDPDGRWIAAHAGYRRDPVGAWVRDADGHLVVHEDELDGYRVRRYRPRIETIFARIERWSRTGSPDDVHWRSMSKENILTVYGLDADSRIADPLDPSRIFSWQICELRDDRGNAVLYRYKAEDGLGIDLERAHERNRGARDDSRRTANRYPKRIHYGNRAPLLDATGQRPRFLDRGQIADAGWMFEVVLDYGEHHPQTPAPDDDRRTDAEGRLEHPWKARADPFSAYRAGFEVRTARLCRRILMFHHFPEEPGVDRDCLVRSVDFEYSSDVDPTDVRNPVYTFLKAVTQLGYRRRGDGYDRRGLPPVEFEYSEPVVQDLVEDVDPASLENLPVGLDGSMYRWIDLHGEGLPGVLTEQGGGWFYKRNLSPLPVTLPDGREYVRAAFAPLETVGSMPNVALSSGAQLMDLAGDGQPDIVMLEGPTPGLYEHDDDEGWKPFRPFLARLARDPRDPNLRFLDLDGDGQADALITEDDAFVWHQSLGEAGFGPARRIEQALDEEKGPRVVFADATQSIHLADLSGDGLADIARVRNGEISYWPNLGYGRFGAKVTMDNAPWFDDPDHFEPQRVRLADIDGSGTTDIIYLHRDGVRLFFNQSGNSWGRPQPLKVFPRSEELVSVVAADLLGNGTACLVWSSPLPGDARRPLRYVNLMGERKPHLLVRTVNNLGAETRVQYAPSTRFYLQDKLAGRPWITRLPFPVHVVARVDTHDHISRNRFVTRYAYHHGFLDGEEREFRGFGTVEQWDTEELAALEAPGAPADGADVIAASDVAPIHTTTWFHTGLYVGRDHVSDALAREYFREPGTSDAEARAVLLPDTVLPAGLSAEEEREACRALKGSMLRQEVYADDARPGATAGEIERARTPYSVTEQNFTVRPLQPRAGNRHAVFSTHTSQALIYHYERNPADPRIEHALTLETDDYGNVLKRAMIGYGRRPDIRTIDAAGDVREVPNPGFTSLTATDRTKQTRALLVLNENRVTNAVESADSHRNPAPCEQVTFELTGYRPTGPAGRYRPADLVERDPSGTGRLRTRVTDEVPYEAAPTARQCRRPIEWLRTLYRRDDLTSLLPLGELQPLALPGEGYRLAFTPGLLADVFRRPRPGEPTEPLLPDPGAVLGGRGGDEGGYLQSQTLKADGRFPATDVDDLWWMPSGRSFFSPDPADDAATELAQARDHFFLTRRHRDPFDHDSRVDFDDYDLLITETRDAVGNRVTVGANDYRVLHPRIVIDPNRNRTEVAFDTVGMVVATALMGKPLPAPVEGDTLAGFSPDVSEDERDRLFEGEDPLAGAADLLRSASTRIVYDLDRFHRTRLAAPDDPARWRPPGAATLARETHASAPLPPHGLRIQLTFSYSDGFGREIQRKARAEPGPVAEDGPVVTRRWAASGWTIFDNKGRPVRQYEPFFSATQQFEFGVTVGVSPVLFYDPAGRVVVTLRPNHTYDKVVFDPWQQTTYDVNDTCAPRNAQTGDPHTDPDVAGLVARYFAAVSESTSQVWKTWFQQRIDGALGPHEQAAASRAAAHADTPTTAHFDALGRPFLSVARNRVAGPGPEHAQAEARVATRTDLDIEGNQRSVRDGVQQAGDPLGRIVVRYAYDMLGNRVHELSMEAAARWMLSDAIGSPIRVWDSRGHNFVTAYDALRRPVAQTVRGTIASGEAASDPGTLGRDVLIERTEYGEPPRNAGAEEEDRAVRLNLRTRVLRHFDGAGVVTNARLDDAGEPSAAYDFKGNLLFSARRLARDYRATLDWSRDPPLEEESFRNSVRYDAFNRAIQSVLPHSSHARAKRHVIQPVFNEANLLERLDVWLERDDELPGPLDPAHEPPSPVGVANIDYDAKGRRLGIDYANGVSTRYRYDRETFRLIRLSSRRDGHGPGLQELQYTYDPSGNVTHIQDDALAPVFFRNKRVVPSGDYTYDALYRLIEATGREHLGQQGDGARNRPGPPAVLDGPDTPHALARYVERYTYDVVGNLLRMQHRGRDPVHAGWTRGYAYAETSLIEGGASGGPPKTSNRLSSTTLNPDGPQPAEIERYQHDRHGSMVRMPHLSGGTGDANLHWDCTDRLRQADLGGGGTAFYVYDAAGQRVRKVCEKAPGLTEERIYLGDFELFRRHPGPIGADTAALERESVHTMDDRQRVALVELRTVDASGDDPAPARLVRYQLADHVGSSTVELDEEARIISYEEYAPYGASTYRAVRSLTETPKRYRFTGKERDEETGLSQHGARYYAPWLGRWTSADPAGLVDGPNLYRYARGSPLVLVDPAGTQPSPAVDPETVLIAATALQRAAQAWGTASVITGGVATVAPAAAGAAPAAAPVAAPAAGLSTGAAGALLGAQVAAAAAMALTLRWHMQRAGSIARYGNPYGMPSRDIAFPVLKAIEQNRTEPFPIPEPVPEPSPDKEEKRQPKPGRIYVTYTKFNSQTGRYYSGRTSAVIDLSLPWAPQARAAVRARDANHHVDENDEPSNPSFGPAVLDQFAVGYAVNYNQRYRDVGYLVIRGREQQLIDYYGARRAAELGINNFSGGAQSDTHPGTPLTENSIRGIGKDNPLGEVFHNAANLAFGELAPFTGNRIQQPAAARE